jgi:hypothetical protein
MTTWTFDLDQTLDPNLRLGLFGLWRMLRYCRDPQFSHLYTRVPDGLTWNLKSDTVLEITFQEEDDIVGLMASMLGDAPHGLLVPPGYTDDRNSPAICATILAHRGITQCFQGGKRGARRYLSLAFLDINVSEPAEGSTESPVKKRARELAKERQEYFDARFPEVDIWESAAPLTRIVKGKVEPLAFFFRPYTTFGTSRTFLDPFKPSGLGPFHPGYAKVNDTDIKGTPQEKLLLGFSCLAYIYISYGAGLVGVGADAPTFSEADRYHSLVQEGRKQPLWMVQGDPETAAFGVLAYYDFPFRRTYQIASVKSDTKSKPRYHPLLYWGQHEPLREVFLHAMTFADVEQMICRVRAVPVFTQKDHTTSALDRLRRNIDLSLHWAAGFQTIPGVGWWSNHNSDVLATIAQHMESPMEQKFAKQLRGALIRRQQWHKRSGRDGKKSSWERARQDFAMAFRNCNSRTGALTAFRRVTEMVAQATGPNEKYPFPFTEDVVEFIYEMASKRPQDLHSLTILHLYARPKSSTPKDAPTNPEPAESTDDEYADEPPDEDLD